MIGLGVQSEGSCVIFELFDGDKEIMRVFKKFYWTDDLPWNKIVINPAIDLALEFVLIGAQGRAKICRLDFDLSDRDMQDESTFDT